MKTKLYSKWFRLILLLTWLPIVTFSQVISQGPYNPALVTEQTPGCLSCPGVNWNNPENAMFADNMYATAQLGPYPNCFMSNCYYPRALWPANFGFTIPATAAITGIKAEVLRFTNTLNAVTDSVVYLLKNSMPSGNNHAFLTQWNTLPSNITYGDSTDLWGTTWTPAQINATDFGLFFKPMNSLATSAFVYVDHVRITVYYITTTGIHQNQSSEFNMFFDVESQSLKINFIPEKSEQTELKITDVSGKLILQQQFRNSLAKEKINLQFLRRGIYFAHLQANEQKIILKFFVN